MTDENTLTIYSKDYDDGQDVFGSGMSGKVFLENGNDGKEFKSIDDALNYIVKSKNELHKIDYCYQDKDVQMFKKFYLKASS